MLRTAPASLSGCSRRSWASWPRSSPPRTVPRRQTTTLFLVGCSRCRVPWRGVANGIAPRWAASWLDRRKEDVGVPPAHRLLGDARMAAVAPRRKTLKKGAGPSEPCDRKKKRQRKPALFYPSFCSVSVCKRHRMAPAGALGTDSRKETGKRVDRGAGWWTQRPRSVPRLLKRHRPRLFLAHTGPPHPAEDDPRGTRKLFSL